MRQLVGSVGILLNFIGVVMMLRYGLPYPLRQLGNQPELSDRDLRERDRRHLLGATGLLAFAVGNVLFMMSNAWID